MDAISMSDETETFEWSDEAEAKYDIDEHVGVR